MNSFLTGKYPITDEFRINRNVEIYKFLRRKKDYRNAEDLKISIKNQIQIYTKMYGRKPRRYE